MGKNQHYHQAPREHGIRVDRTAKDRIYHEDSVRVVSVTLEWDRFIVAIDEWHANIMKEEEKTRKRPNGVIGDTLRA